MSNDRWEILFTGHVQGVGFRYQTMNVARNYEVTGWVSNLPTGQVQVVVEGEPSQIGQFVENLKTAMLGYVRSVEIKKGKSTNGFASFEIRR